MVIENKNIAHMTNKKIKELYEQIKQRKQYYGIVDFKLQDHQKQLLENIRRTKQDEKGEILPYYKYLLFQGGNGAGKTITALYIVSLFLMGELTQHYKLPYIGNKRKIYVGTKSGSNLKSTIETYMLGDYSPIRLPPEVVKSVTRDNGTIKSIVCVNGNTINFFTYDQGYERIQGTNGDLYLLDEEPKDSKVFTEALARTRGKKAQLFLSMTPLSGYTPVYEFFYEQTSDKVIAASSVMRVSALDNKHADHTWADGLTEDEKKMRLEGAFVPPSGLVYPNFSRDKHTVEFFDPRELEDVNFYGGLDFGVDHPTAFAAIAVDGDGKIYVFDLIYERRLLIKDLAKGIKDIERKHGIIFDKIIADSAGARERSELKEHGINTKPADKSSKGENDMSNRRAGIMKVNQLLYDNKLFLADHLKEAIKEFENHFYKEGGKRDGEVEKISDDFLRCRCVKIFHIQLQTTCVGKQIKEKVGRQIWNSLLHYKNKKRLKEETLLAERHYKLTNDLRKSFDIFTYTHHPRGQAKHLFSYMSNSSP